MTDRAELFAFLWKETDHAGCSFFCGVELVVVIQQKCKYDQTLPCRRAAHESLNLLSPLVSLPRGGP